jgi:hypothetical protein
VSLPSIERTSPRDMARATAASGHFHDVVIAASKVLNDAPLAEADRASLRWARGLLNRASTRTVLLHMPSARQLAGDGTLTAAIREAAQSDGGGPEKPLRELRRSIDRCLHGTRDDSVTASMQKLRELFAAVSRLALQADVLSQAEPPSPEPWTHSTTSLAS